MCLQCHLGLEDELILKQLQESIKLGSKSFPDYNTTGLSHITIASSGFNGLEVRNTAIELMKMYVEWLKVNQKYILNQEHTPEKLTLIIDKTKNSYIKEKNIKSLEKYFADME